MPSRKLQPCNRVDCNRLTRGTYCDDHQEEIDLKRQNNRSYTDRRYNIDRKTRDKESYTFYHSNEWQELRMNALVRDSGLCQDCKLMNKVTPAEQVHHIVAIKNAWDKRFNINNLISLCKNCHNKRHNR